METQTFSKEEKEEIIRYGLDRIKSICTMTFVTLLMGCIFQMFFQSIIFLVCFIVLRKYAGGYHADRMRIRGKKDSASSSSKALNISGTVIP